MMRKMWLWLMVVVGLGLAQVSDAAIRQFYRSVAVTTASQAFTFGFQATSVALVNDGSVSAYLTFENRQATTADIEIKASEAQSYTVPDDPRVREIPSIERVSLIGANTTTVRVVAIGAPR